MDEADGTLYLSTANQTSGGGVFRSTNGTSWTSAASGGFGSTDNISVPTLFVADGFLYAGTRNPTAGAEIWRAPIPASSSGWSKVHDFSVDDNITTIASIYSWNGMLYTGTDDDSVGGHLYESLDGVTWSKNSGVGDGLGNSDNAVITSLLAYDGYLYLTTRNPISGGELWRTDDAATWSPIAGAFTVPGNEEIHSIRLAGELLWLSARSSGTNLAEVWVSSDGVTFTQSNIDGFGDESTKGGLPTIVEFGELVYWAGENATTGGPIYRLQSCP